MSGRVWELGSVRVDDEDQRYGTVKLHLPGVDRRLVGGLQAEQGRYQDISQERYGLRPFGAARAYGPSAPLEIEGPLYVSARWLWDSVGCWLSLPDGPRAATSSQSFCWMTTLGCRLSTMSSVVVDAMIWHPWIPRDGLTALLRMYSDAQIGYCAGRDAERAVPPPPRRRVPRLASKRGGPCFVYVFVAKHAVKVGISAAPQQRRRAIANAGGLTSVWTAYLHECDSVADARVIESWAHAALADHRARGEWFTCHSSVAVQAVIAAADRLEGV